MRWPTVGVCLAAPIALFRAMNAGDALAAEGGEWHDSPRMTNLRFRLNLGELAVCWLAILFFGAVLAQTPAAIVASHPARLISYLVVSLVALGATIHSILGWIRAHPLQALLRQWMKLETHLKRDLVSRPEGRDPRSAKLVTARTKHHQAT